MDSRMDSYCVFTHLFTLLKGANAQTGLLIVNQASFSQPARHVTNVAADQGTAELKDSSSSPVSIESDAKKDLDELAKWLRKAKMIQKEECRWLCDDPQRSVAPRTLLQKMNLYKGGYVIALSRISGKTIVKKDKGFDNLFIPLSGEIDVCGQHLKPGQYVRFTSDQVVDAQLDFLTVAVPETTSVD
ncbi:hypothetical protein ACJ73_08431 [Blastomyces percursus]|uniref:Uncharacterized protein n=1 Tax=Blastomyces percursus TaxID=1658174 RepID=A0A1J9QVL0_9EURO|nr:hypothetical protein ACJ73_08431 [Blastomyces percursus]